MKRNRKLIARFNPMRLPHQRRRMLALYLAHALDALVFIATLGRYKSIFYSELLFSNWVEKYE